MATAVICDVQGCTQEATPAGLRLKNGTSFDICPEHRAAIGRRTVARTRPGATRASRASDGPVRPRTKQSDEEKARYARAKAWHIARGTVSSSQRGQVSGAQFEEYAAATGDRG